MPTAYETIGDNVYRRKTTGRLYGRFWINGKRVRRKLDSLTVKAAREEIALKQSEHNRAKIGLASDPFANKLTIATLAEKWAAAGYPGRRRDAKINKDTTAYQVGHLVECLGHLEATAITPKVRNQYHAWRVERVTRGKGDRTVEIELGVLSNMLWWAAEHLDGFTLNPVALTRRTYRGVVAHCTERMPRGDDEVHQLANFLMGDPDSESAAWQLLFEALTGCRTSEILDLRMDAAPEAPGYVNDKYLCVHRAKHGCYPWILLDAVPGFSPLRELIDAHREWHRERWPASPWYFPGRFGNRSDPGRLTHAMTKACKALGMEHRSSHGLRAYHVATLRALGVDDSEIARRLGHRSGVHLVEVVYGEIKPGWAGSMAQDFLPTPGDENHPEPEPCAWAPWIPFQITGQIVSLNTATHKQAAL